MTNLVFCLLNSSSTSDCSAHSKSNFVRWKRDSFDKDKTIIAARIYNVFPHLSVLSLS